MSVNLEFNCYQFEFNNIFINYKANLMCINIICQCMYIFSSWKIIKIKSYIYIHIKAFKEWMLQGPQMVKCYYSLVLSAMKKVFMFNNILLNSFWYSYSRFFFMIYNSPLIFGWKFKTRGKHLSHTLRITMQIH